MTPSRLINVLVGCGIGFGLLRLGGRSDWLIPFALAATVLISTYVSSAVFPKVTRYDRSRITTRGLPRVESLTCRPFRPGPRLGTTDAITVRRPTERPEVDEPMQASETESAGFSRTDVDEPVRIWIESGDGTIARGFADVLSEGGVVVRLAGPASVAPGDEVAVRIAFDRTSPTLAATARILWIRSADEEPECELEWTHSGPERARLVSLVASLF